MFSSALYLQVCSTVFRPISVNCESMNVEYRLIHVQLSRMVMTLLHGNRISSDCGAPHIRQGYTAPKIHSFKKEIKN